MPGSMYMYMYVRIYMYMYVCMYIAEPTALLEEGFCTSLALVFQGLESCTHCWSGEYNYVYIYVYIYMRIQRQLYCWRRDSFSACSKVHAHWSTPETIPATHVLCACVHVCVSKECYTGKRDKPHAVGIPFSYPPLLVLLLYT